MKPRIVKHSTIILFSGIAAIAVALALLPDRIAAPVSAQQAVPIPPNIVSIPPGQAYRQTNFISDIPGLAFVEDPYMVNPWGMTFRGTSPFWVANNGTSTTQLIRGDVGGAPVVLNPSPQTISIPGGLPTGTVGNSTSDFQITPPGGGTPAASNFIFASETGNITAWNGASGASAQTVVSHPGRVYTGLAIGANAGGNLLYVADFANNHIDVYNGTFTLTTVSGGFIDATIPAGYAPFNIQNLGGSLYVTYALVDPITGDSVNGVGNGLVRKFTTDGVRILTFGINDISTNPSSQLNAPWGLTIAPAPFGIFGGALLVGNFGEGNPSIHAYDPNTGVVLLAGDNALKDESGTGIEIDELWALQFGNGGSGGDVNTLYFTSGIGEEEHGLFGSLKPTTATATSLIQFGADSFAIGEGSGHIDIPVIRAGDTSGTATVNINTFDESQEGHATQKSDYEIALGKLTFNPGETVKTLRILIVNDLFVENNEIVNLALSNVSGAGAGLASPSEATLTIIDNDAAAPIITQRSAVGTNAAAITPARDQFRVDIGGGTVAGANGSFGGVRREINWDGVPQNFSAPNLLPGNFFNVNSPRGAILSTTAGSGGFQVSGASTDSGPGQPALQNFGNINPTYTTTFQQFSPQRLFTALGSTITDVTFFVPGTTNPATVTSFGSVFTDVDTAGSTKMQFFDVFDVLITEQSVPAQSGTATLSFLGLTIPNRPIRRVRIISGNAPLGGNDNPPANDLVVMDDFIYSEPVPAVIPSPGPNPIDDSSFFVRQHYLDFLNREPDAPGLNFWVNQIESCGVDVGCREVRRINVSASFFLSIEFQNTGLEALLTHRAAFGPSAFGSPAPVLYGTFERDTQALQKDFIFLQPGADVQLEANKVAFFNDFVTRPEFVTKYPSTLTNDQYVDNLLASAGMSPSNFIVNLTNAQENPPTNPTTTGGARRPASYGTATFSMDAAQTQMTFTATISNIDFTGSQTADTNDNLVAAHIHASPSVTPTTNAGVVWGFFGMPFNDNNPNDVVQTNGPGVGGTISGKWDPPEGNGTTFAAQLTNLKTGHAYINFHTTQFGGGEIRGNFPEMQGLRDSLVAGLNAATLTRAQVLRQVAESAFLRDRELNRAFVFMEYAGYLRRDPDTAGFNFWLQKLNDFGGSFINAEMVKAFISSSEYRQRFGSS